MIATAMTRTTTRRPATSRPAVSRARSRTGRAAHDDRPGADVANAARPLFAPPSEGPAQVLRRLAGDLMNLKKLPRTGWCLRGIADPESLADHCFGVVLLTWALAGRQPKALRIDPDRALRMALMHELGECRVGDIPFPALRYLKGKGEAEDAAVRDVLAGVGPMGDEGLALFREFEEGKSATARFVRAVDKLEMLLTAAEYERTGYRTLEDYWKNPTTFAAFAGFPEIDELARWLRQRHLERRDARPGPL